MKISRDIKKHLINQDKCIIVYGGRVFRSSMLKFKRRLEHMRSANWFLNIHLYLMNLVTKLLVGTSMIRETQKNIEKAGFEIESVRI